MHEIHYLPLSKKDLQNTVSYITDKLNSPGAAMNLLENLKMAISSLREFPYSHSVYSTIKPLKEEYRILPVKNYAIFYVVREAGKKVEIYRVIYVKRDLLQTLADGPL